MTKFFKKKIKMGVIFLSEVVLVECQVGVDGGGEVGVGRRRGRRGIGGRGGRRERNGGGVAGEEVLKICVVVLDVGVGEVVLFGAA